MIQRLYSDASTPKTPELSQQTDHECKLIRLARCLPDPKYQELKVHDLLLDLKYESESLLQLIEQYHGQTYPEL